MQFVVYTVTAILLYLFADWILNKIELGRGKRLEHRSIVFLAIIMVLAVGSFKIIELLMSQ
jgi:hypothetical protein